jgi:hypothetical protein
LALQESKENSGANQHSPNLKASKLLIYRFSIQANLFSGVCLFDFLWILGYM